MLIDEWGWHLLNCDRRQFHRGQLETGKMRETVIVSAVRTAVGKAPKGTLKNTRPDDLGATAIREAVDRVDGLDKSQVEDVIMGCAFPEAEQGMNVARTAMIAAG